MRIKFRSYMGKIGYREHIVHISNEVCTGAYSRSSKGNSGHAESDRARPLEENVLAKGSSAERNYARISVVIPALNEAKNLPHVFDTLPSGLHEVILVDGNSVDGTVAVAQTLRKDVRIIAQGGLGKGNALIAGFSFCTGDIIVMIDADGSMDGAEIKDFVAALENGADFAKGSRFKRGGRSDDITRVRRWGNWLLSRTVNVLFGTRYTDLCYGYNAFWARHLDLMQLDCAGFEVETLINIRVARAGLRVKEVASYEHNRIHGVSNLHVLRTGVRIIAVIAREWTAALRERKHSFLHHDVSTQVISAGAFEDSPTPETPAS